MKIRILLPAVVSSLAFLLLAIAGYDVYEALGQRRDATAFINTSAISALLLQSVDDWGVERGLANAALSSGEAADKATLDAIRAERARADKSFKDALERVRKIPAMAPARQSITDAEQAYNALQALRGKVDEDVGKGFLDRRVDVGKSFVPTISTLIDKANWLRLSLETVTRPPAAQLVQFVNLRHLAAEMAEYAGRERARLAAIIARREKLSASDLGVLSEGRGHIDLAWNTISILRLRSDLNPRLRAAIDAVEKEYFGNYGTLREAIFAAGDTGNYPVEGKAYLDRVTAAINTILTLTHDMGEAADAAANADAGASSSWALTATAALGLGLAICAISLWFVLWRVCRPIRLITQVMDRLAGGDKSVSVVGTERRDEIGAMAKAVQVFKDNAVAMDRMREEQAEAERRAEREKREALLRLADGFEASVAGVVGTVSTAASRMETTAQSMSSTAEAGNERANTLASAAEQASANVQTVASAAEELSASISEISRQVAKASNMTSEAAEKGRQTDETVQGLANAAQRISDVVKLIEDIANQTNLLALNATIEAARAGEAGKGFSVVASEVKNLANQTGKATEDIRVQIGAIQGEVQHAVDAIRGISQTVTDINGISTSIAAAMEQQGAATQEIARNVQQAAAGTQQVSENVAGVTTAAGETGTAAAQMLGSASALSKEFTALRGEVDKFLATIRAA